MEIIHRYTAPNGRPVDFEFDPRARTEIEQALLPRGFRFSEACPRTSIERPIQHDDLAVMLGRSPAGPVVGPARPPAALPNERRPAPRLSGNELVGPRPDGTVGPVGHAYGGL